MTTKERISNALTKAEVCLDAAKGHTNAEVADALTRQARAWITLAVTAANHPTD